MAALSATALAFGVHVASLVAARPRVPGDGRNPASYGFDLGGTSIPAAEIVASGMSKDGLRALVDPAVWSLAEAGGSGAKRSKFLVPSDRVIGLAIGGEARADPLRLLDWHEVVNYTLGGHPVAVTYNPLCDSAVVFDRPGPSPLRFGVSGLLYQSNLLMYDRREGGKGESLWSQLLFRAVSGPAGLDGASLSPVAFSLVTWGDWRAAHPGTTVLAPDPRLAQQYKRDPYSSYFGSDLLRFPVRPLPTPESGPYKTPVVALFAGGAWHAFPYPAISEHAGASGTWNTEAGGVPLSLRIRREAPQTVEVLGAGAALPSVHSFLFAWTATHGGDTVWHR